MTIGEFILCQFLLERLLQQALRLFGYNNKRQQTIKIGFLKSESQTMTFLKCQSQHPIILCKALYSRCNFSRILQRNSTLKRFTSFKLVTNVSYVKKYNNHSMF